VAAIISVRPPEIKIKFTLEQAMKAQRVNWKVSA
jgi:hypothetical protein